MFSVSFGPKYLQIFFTTTITIHPSLLGSISQMKIYGTTMQKSIEKKTFRINKWVRWHLKQQGLKTGLESF